MVTPGVPTDGDHAVVTPDAGAVLHTEDGTLATHGEGEGGSPGSWTTDCFFFGYSEAHGWRKGVLSPRFCRHAYCRCGSTGTSISPMNSGPYRTRDFSLVCNP